MMIDSVLRCPVCKKDTSLLEWRRVFRYVRSGAGKPAIRVLRHTVCDEIAYFLIE